MRFQSHVQRENTVKGRRPVFQHFMKRRRLLCVPRVCVCSNVRSVDDHVDRPTTK